MAECVADHLDAARAQREGMEEGLRIRSALRRIKLAEESTEAFLQATNCGESALMLCEAHDTGMPFALFKLHLSEWLLKEGRPHVLDWPELHMVCSGVMACWGLQTRRLTCCDLAAAPQAYVYQHLPMRAGQMWIGGVRERRAE
jgi:hypothetical protein